MAEQNTTQAGNPVQKGNPVVWFEIPVKNLDRATKFYAAAFDWVFDHQEMGPMKLAMLPGNMQQYGTCGALVLAPGYEPAQTGTLVYIACEDVAAQIARVEKAGGTVLVPRTSIGQWGFIAHFADPEGNRVGIHSMK